MVAEPVLSDAPVTGGLETVDPPVAADEPAAAPRAGLPVDFGKPERPTELQYTAPTPEGGVQTTQAGSALDGVLRNEDDQSRNALCACGSGKKFKRCHGDPRNKA